MAHACHPLRSRLDRNSPRFLALAPIALGAILSLILANPGRAQTSSDSPASSGSASATEAPAPTTSAEESSPASGNTDDPHLVWTEVTTESGTMMVLRPASPSGATPLSNPVLNETSPVGADRRDNFSSFQSPASSSRTSPQRYGSNTPPHLPGVSAFGVYGGFPSAVGFQFVIPTDATVAFRTGFIGMPGIGYLVTPGLEIRFNQTPGTYNVDSAYTFSNLYLGETVKDGPNDSHWGLESGIGYRWILPDRRGVRWVTAVEFGGRWTTESAWPDKPSVRAFWMIAAP